MFLLLAMGIVAASCGKKANEWNAETEKDYLDKCSKESAAITKEVCDCRLAKIKEAKILPDKAWDLSTTMKVGVECAFSTTGDILNNALNGLTNGLKDVAGAIDTTLKNATDNATTATTGGNHGGGH